MGCLRCVIAWSHPSRRPARPNSSVLIHLCRPLLIRIGGLARSRLDTTEDRSVIRSTTNLNARCIELEPTRGVSSLGARSTLAGALARPGSCARVAEAGGTYTLHTGQTRRHTVTERGDCAGSGRESQCQRLRAASVDAAAAPQTPPDSRVQSSRVSSDVGLEREKSRLGAVGLAVPHLSSLPSPPSSAVHNRHLRDSCTFI